MNGLASTSAAVRPPAAERSVEEPASAPMPDGLSMERPAAASAVDAMAAGAAGGWRAARARG
jgi:hypothetical protein